MNAYQLYEAAFDTANDSAENTVAYVVEYADGAMNVSVSSEVAQKVVDCRAAWLAEVEATGGTQHMNNVLVKHALEDIEL